MLVVQVGYINPRKNQLEEVEAFAAVVKQCPEARLILLGDAEKDNAYTLELQTRIHALGLDEHVILAGFHTDVRTFLCGADIQLHTALQDPHPRAVLEGMAAHLPVVAYNTDGVGETVLSGKTGYLVPQHDVTELSRHLIELVGDAERRTEMGQCSYEHVDMNFQASHTAELIADMIEKTLSA